MKLLTKAILKSVPPLYAQDGKKPEKVKIHAKFFTPWASFTWYMTELDQETGDAYGYIKTPQGGQYYGYFSMKELESISGPARLKVERDRHFSGTLADVM